MEALKWLWDYLKIYRWRLVGFIILSVTLICTVFIEPLVLGYLVGCIENNNITRNALISGGLLVIIFTVLKEFVTYIRAILAEHVSQDAILCIRNKIYQNLQKLDCRFFDTTPTGDLISRFTMDTDAIRIAICTTLPAILDQLCYIIIGFAIIFTISPILGAAFLPVMPPVAYFAYKLAQKNKVEFVKIREANAELNTVVKENIEANRVVKAYVKEDYEIEKFEKKNVGYKDTFMHQVKVWKKHFLPLNFSVQLSNLVFILIGGALVLSDVVSVGQYATIHGCLWFITTPMASLGNIVNQYQQFWASTIKIRDLQNSTPEICNQDVKKRGTGITGKIEFKNVTFSYDDKQVVKNLSFVAEPGDTIALVGPTGSGKSTVINLLYRFYDPSYGTIYVDDINIKNFDLETLRTNIAGAMQDIFLFSDTIRNNIAFGTPNATDDEIKAVAKMADAHEFISKLPDGYDTLVGERGAGLSGGQKQRICLARALLKNPSILILDDATSALDTETEFFIQGNLRKTHRTKIIIAHRISSVKNADLILVFNHGQLVEWGKHETLLHMDGYYKGVYERQLGDFNHLNKEVEGGVTIG